MDWKPAPSRQNGADGSFKTKETPPGFIIHFFCVDVPLFYLNVMKKNMLSEVLRLSLGS